MKTFLTFLLVLIISTGFAQEPYAGVQLNTKGFGTSIGFLVDKVDVSAGYSVPFMSATESTILHLSAGKQFLLTKHDKDNYSVTASVGLAIVNGKEFTNKQETDLVGYSDVKPLYGIEFGKDAFMGRLVVSFSYVDKFYAGAGIRIFFCREQD